MGRLLLHHHHHHHHHPPTEDPLRLSYGAVEVLPVSSSSSSCRRRGLPSLRCCCFPLDVTTTCKFVVFLLVYGVVAWVVGAVLLALVLLSAALVPLGGLGVWLFRFIFRVGVVDVGAKCDAAIVNYVAPPHDRIRIDGGSNRPPPLTLLPTRGYDDDHPHERLVAGLRAVSAESAMVLVYLSTLKLVLATAGLGVVALVLALPALLVHALLAGRLPRVVASSSVGGGHGTGGGVWEAVCACAVVVLAFVVAVMAMDLVVALCGAATRFFCCERVYTVPLPRVGGASSHAGVAVSSYPNVVVIRLPPSATGVYTFASAAASTRRPATAATDRGSDNSTFASSAS